MRLPTDLERERLMHIYDPTKAHQYYEEHKKLKGRKKGQQEQPSSQDPRTGKTKQQIHQGARAKQKKELTQAVHNLQQRLNQLEALIKKRTHEEQSENRKGKAKKERAAKERDKPKTAAEKRKQARESEKYRDKHKQTLKNKSKARDGKSGGSSSKSSGSNKKHSVSELKSLATKVRGQIAVAKQKLAAL